MEDLIGYRPLQREMTKDFSVQSQPFGRFTEALPHSLVEYVPSCCKPLILLREMESLNTLDIKVTLWEG
jgi:hypothetical protein